MDSGVISHDNITLGTSRKHSFWTHLGLLGPLEVSRGQTKQTMGGIEVVYGILKQVGSVQRPQKCSVSIISLWGRPENTQFGLIWAS